MSLINKKYVSIIWQSLSEDPNMDPELLGLNMNRTDSLYRILIEKVMPSFEELPEFIKARCKNSLEFAINYENEDSLRRNYESAIPIFDPPGDISMKELHKLLWETLFPNAQCEKLPCSMYDTINLSDLYKR